LKFEGSLNRQNNTRVRNKYIHSIKKDMAASNASEKNVVVLHKWSSPPSPSNPSPSDLSFDLECLRVETYLRLAGINYEEEVCPSHSSSPSSVLPCLEAGNGEYTVVGGLADEIKSDPKVATYRILHHLKHERRNLNDSLSETDKARDVCFSSIANGMLKEACEYFTWTHESTFIEKTRPMYGSKYPFPLNRIVPNKWREKRGSPACDEIKARVIASQAFEVIETMLPEETGGGDIVFALGSTTPTNCDADLFSVLYYVVFSNATENLRAELKSYPKVIDYVDKVKKYVHERKPLNAESDETNTGSGKKIDPTTWRDGARRKKQQGWVEKEEKRKLSPDEKKMRRHAVYSVLFALSSVVAFVMFSPGMTMVVEMDDLNDGAPASEEEVVEGGSVD
jgi:hypothetical protein